jgi:hypothetical protein
MKEVANQGGLVESPPKAGMGGDYARNKQIWPRCFTRLLLAAQSTKKPVGMSATGQTRKSSCRA